MSNEHFSIILLVRSDNGCATFHVVTHKFLTALAWDHS